MGVSRAFMALVVGIGLLACLSCGDDDGARSTPTPERSTPDFARFLAEWEEENVPPAARQDVQERYEAAVAAENEKPVFEGTVEGFTFYEQDPVNGNPEVERWCQDATSGPSDGAISLGYQPPKTRPSTEQQARTCGDGRIVSYYQGFGGDYSSFGVMIQMDNPLVSSFFSEDRLVVTEVNGSPAVGGAPLISEGTGPSYLVFRIGNGQAFIEAYGLPLEETIRIAEGLKCNAC